MLFLTYKITKGFAGIVACRVFIGLPEAAFYPGAIFLLSRWYTKKVIVYTDRVFPYWRFQLLGIDIPFCFFILGFAYCERIRKCEWIISLSFRSICSCRLSDQVNGSWNTSEYGRQIGGSSVAMVGRCFGVYILFFFLKTDFFRLFFIEVRPCWTLSLVLWAHFRW